MRRAFIQLLVALCLLAGCDNSGDQTRPLDKSELTVFKYRITHIVYAEDWAFNPEESTTIDDVELLEDLKEAILDASCERTVLNDADIALAAEEGIEIHFDSGGAGLYRIVTPTDWVKIWSNGYDEHSGPSLEAFLTRLYEFMRTEDLEN